VTYSRIFGGCARLPPDPHGAKRPLLHRGLLGADLARSRPCSRCSGVSGLRRRRSARPCPLSAPPIARDGAAAPHCGKLYTLLLLFAVVGGHVAAQIWR